MGRTLPGMAVENAPRSVAPAGSWRTSRPRFPIRPQAGHTTGWGQTLTTGFAVAAVAGAGQLGVAYGLGLLRLARSFPSDGLWSTQLTWTAWFALGAVLAGVAGGRLAADRYGLSPALGGRIAVGMSAGLGAAVLIPLTAIPARAAELPERPGGLAATTPVLEICLAAGLGVLAGIALAVIALGVRLVAVSVTLMLGLTWLLALISLAPSLAPEAAPPLVRLAVLDLPSGAGAPPVLAVLTSPVLALLVCGAIALAARSRGLPPLQTAAATAAAPGLVAFAYLIGSPGSGEPAVQTSPYAGALLSVAAGLLAALLIGVIRPPAEATGPATEPGRETPTEELPMAATGTLPPMVAEEPPLFPVRDAPLAQTGELPPLSAQTEELPPHTGEAPPPTEELPPHTREAPPPTEELPPLHTEEAPPFSTGQPPLSTDELPVAGRPPSGGSDAPFKPNVEPPAWAVAPEPESTAVAPDPVPAPETDSTPDAQGTDSIAAVSPVGADPAPAAPAKQPRRLRKPLFGRRKRRQPESAEPSSAQAASPARAEPILPGAAVGEPAPPESTLDGKPAASESVLEGELVLPDPDPAPKSAGASDQESRRLKPESLDLDSLDLESFMSRAREFTSGTNRTSAEPTASESADTTRFQTEPTPASSEPGFTLSQPGFTLNPAEVDSDTSSAPEPVVEEPSSAPSHPDKSTKASKAKTAKHAKTSKRRKSRSKSAAEPMVPAPDSPPASAGKKPAAPAEKKSDPEDEHISWISSLSTDPEPTQPDTAASADHIRRRLRRDPY